MRNFMQKIIKSIDNKDQVEVLLNQYRNEGNFINEKDDHGDSLLHFASRIHCIPVMDLLIKHGADPEAVNEHGRRPIHEVIDSIECVSYFVNTCHVDINAMKRGDWTPVMIAALKGDIDIVKLLVDAGALLNRTTKDGRTALYLAVQEGHIELSKYLTDQYSQAITQATKSGRFPTQAAAALVANENEYDSENTAAYITTTYLISHATIPLLDLLQHRDNSGRDILLDSAVSQNLRLLKFLLDQRADPNDADSLGRNMIHHASMMGHLNVLELIYQLQGINWNAPDSWDLWTPLMHAARQGHLDVVKYLVEIVHVNIDCQDKQGRTAKDIACLWNHSNIVNLL